MKIPDSLIPVWRSPVALGRALGCHDFDQAHEEAWAFCENRTRAEVQLPRRHLKSTLFSEILPIWLHLRDPRRRTLLMSAELRLGRSFLHQIRRRVEGQFKLPGYPEVTLCELFPWLRIPSVGGFDLSEGISFSGRSGPMKERSIWIGSVDRGKAGWRATEIINDDLQNDTNCRSAIRIWNVCQAYDNEPPLLFDQHRGFIWNVDTPWAFGDLSFYLAAKGVPRYRRTIWSGARPAGWPQHEPPPGPIDATEGHTGWPLCPQILDESGIAYLTDPSNPEHITELDFARWYLLRPIAASDARFTPALLQQATDSRLDEAGLADLPAAPDLLLIDPTNTDSIGANPSAIVRVRRFSAADLGYAHLPPQDAVYVILSAERVRGGLEALASRLRELIARSEGRIQTAFIEAFSSQTAHWLWLRDGLSIPLYGVPMGRGDSKDLRADNLQAALIQRRAVFAPDFPGRDELWGELLRWKGAKGSREDDLLDAASMVCMLGRVVEHKSAQTAEDLPPGSLGSQMRLEQRLRAMRGVRWPNSL